MKNTYFDLSDLEEPMKSSLDDSKFFYLQKKSSVFTTIGIIPAMVELYEKLYPFGRSEYIQFAEYSDPFVQDLDISRFSDPYVFYL